MDEIRRAEARDMDEIMRVIREAQAFIRGFGIDQWQDGYPEREVLLRDVELGQLYVMDDGTTVRAVAALSLLPEPAYDDIQGKWLSDGRYLTIHRMALDDAARGRGGARRLLDEACDLARENGCAGVRIDTHRGNTAMRRFLVKNGFSFCGIVYYRVKKGDPERVAYEKLM